MALQKELDVVVWKAALLVDKTEKSTVTAAVDEMELQSGYLLVHEVVDVKVS